MTQHLRADRSRAFRFALSLAILTVAFLVGLPRAQAQSASIIGTVTDASGAAVPGAKVTVVNVGTAETRSVETNERGDYSVTRLELGSYEVSAEIEGFSRAVATGIQLQVDQVLRRNLALQVGQVTEQITVEADAATVQTDDTTLSTVIDSEKIRELPIPANRNLFRLALLAPGMSRGPASSVTTSGFGNGFGIAAMGQKVHNNAILLDGAPLRTSIHGIVRMRPSVEAIQEFRVESGWYSAEYGTQSGAQIIAAIRPGTNEFHGVLFHFLRNDKLDARNFFESPTAVKKPLRRNTFGGVLSGPIIKNKTFFTVNAEYFRERRSSQGFGIYPTEPMKRGDLTEPFFRTGNTASGALLPIRDLTTGEPFVNNQIPDSRIFPQAKAFFQFWPTPNFGPAQFNGTQNFSGTNRNVDNDEQWFVRIDHLIGDKNKIFGRYGIENVNLDSFPINPNPFFITRRPRRQQNATLNWTRFFGATTLNEAKVSYNRDVFKTVDDISGTDFNILRDLGIPGQTNNPLDTGLPSLGITGVSGLGNTDINTIWDESRQVSDTLSFIKGNHTIKVGTEFTHLRLDRRTVSFVKGAFNFSGIHSGIGLTGAERGRVAWADFLLDQPSQVRLGFTPNLPAGQDPGTYPRTRFWRWHNYITDDWKITPNLTMNIGLRYEYNSVIEDIRGQTRNIVLSENRLFPEVGQRGPIHNPVYDHFAPRLGFAWRPFGGTRTVIRTGFGVFYNVNMVNTYVPAMAANPPNNININELLVAGQPRIGMHNADQASALSITSEINGADLDRNVGDVAQWNMNMQHELRRNLILEVGYVGSSSSHFDSPRTVNAFNPGTTTRPHPLFGNVEIISMDTHGSYHGLLTKLEQRFSSGLTFLQTYTLSKTMFGSFACCGAQRHSNPFDWRSEKGLGETDQRHRTTTAFLYELPFMQGRRDVAGQILGGWQMNGVLTLETGLPIHPTQSLAPVDDGCPRCTRRPDRIADGNLSGDARTLQRWFDTDAFVLARGHYGSSGRNILTAPGLSSLDFSVFKNFPLSETQNIQLRWEMYNATNTPPFNPPTLGVESGNYGKITSAGLGREMQFGLRWEF
jgi:hypothetical protein